MNNTLQPPHVVAQARIKELESVLREVLAKGKFTGKNAVQALERAVKVLNDE